MKKAIVALLLLCPLLAQAATHTGSLSFVASTDATTSSSTTISYALGTCASPGAFTTVTTTGANGYTAANPYSITFPSAGTYCVKVVAVVGGANSPDATVGGTAFPNPVTSLTLTVQ